MFRLTVFAFAVLAGTALVAQPQSVAAAEIVHYQCKDWKAKHIHDNKKAETITATLKKLGCEVKVEEHNGHKDVRYRCVKEKKLPVKTHEEAMKWEKWFKEYGFKAYHTHRVALPKVDLSLADWGEDGPLRKEPSGQSIQVFRPNGVRVAIPQLGSRSHLLHLTQNLVQDSERPVLESDPDLNFHFYLSQIR
ncbi:MAG: hypothetical protein AAFV88_15550 [Planctomycetota bacterium]